MREPTQQWTEMVARVDAFLQIRLPDEPEYRLVELVLRQLLLQDKVLRGEWTRVMAMEAHARLLCAIGRLELQDRLAARYQGALEIRDSDPPQRLLKVSRWMLAEAEAAGSPPEEVEGLKRLVALFEKVRNVFLSSAPAQRQLEVALQQKWRAQYEYLERLDEIIPPELEDHEDMLAEWQQIRRIGPDAGPEPRQAA